MFDDLPMVKNIGIKMSGGTDSSIVAYMTINYIIENNLDIKVYPIVIIEEDSPFQEIFVSQVINFIEKEKNFKFQDKIIRHHSSKVEKIDTIRAVEAELKDSIELIISGITHYPKEDFDDSEGPGDDRIGNFPIMWDNWIYTPVINIDKKGIADLYKKYNLLDTLFPLTRSCTKKTKDFSKHCGKCWWCKERKWAFGKL